MTAIRVARRLAIEESSNWVSSPGKPINTRAPTIPLDRAEAAEDEDRERGDRDEDLEARDRDDPRLTANSAPPIEPIAPPIANARSL